jgi:DNA-directed RNA polymerase subunit delta
MTNIICRASDCIFWEEGICSSDEITYDPEHGCLTFEALEDILDEEEEWDDEDLLDDETLEWEDEDDLLDDDELELDDDELVEDEWEI